MSHMPPSRDDTEFRDFINYAKFQLCRVNNILMKDPIWNSYTDEELIAEYYAVLYYNNDKEREAFEKSLNINEDDDFFEWCQKEELKMLKDKQEELEDSISFKPDMLED